MHAAPRPSRSLAGAAALAAALALASPAAALEGSTPMTGEEFEVYVTGHTLTFAVYGMPYGIEQYLPGRRVLWSFLGVAGQEECREGVWFESGTQICFVYEIEPDRQHCWTFHDTGSGLVAEFEDGGISELVEVARTTEPMYCPGPHLGA